MRLPASGVLVPFLFVSIACEARLESTVPPVKPPPFPAPFSVVPLNVRPILFGTAQGGHDANEVGDTAEDVTFVRRFEDGSRIGVSATRIAQSPFEADAWLIDPGELVAGEQLFIDASCDACDLAASWTVGDARDDAPLDIPGGPPTILGAAGFNYESLAVTHFGVSVRLPPLGGEGLYRFVGDNVDALPAMPAFEDGTRNFNFGGGEARTECFRTVAIDVAGNEVELPEACVDLDPAVNNHCANAGAFPLAAVVLVLLATARRRRPHLVAIVAALAAGPAQATSPTFIAPPGRPFPPSGASIPSNARVVFFGEEHDEIRFVRVDTQEELRFTSEAADSGFPAERLFIVDPGPLPPSQPDQPGQQLVIEASCPTCDAVETAAYDIADRADEDAPGFVFGPVTDASVGELSTVSCVGLTTTEGYFVQATIPPAVDDSGPVLLRIESTEGTRTHDVIAGDRSESISIGFEALPGPPREACATVTAVDVAGHETIFAERVCGDVGGDSGGGCGQTSADAVVLAALAAFLATRADTRKR